MKAAEELDWKEFSRSQREIEERVDRVTTACKVAGHKPFTQSFELWGKEMPAPGNICDKCWRYLFS